MMKVMLMTLSLGASAATLAPANAQSLDVSEGRHLAQTICSKCHEVGPIASPQEVEPGAPSFMDISRMPSMTELAIKVFLRTSHRHMPNIALSSKEIDAIAAYIASLSGK